MSEDHPSSRLYQLRFEQRVAQQWRRVEDINDATGLVIEMRHGPYTSEVYLPLPEDERGRGLAVKNREMIQRMIEGAFNAGDRAARADIRRALGVNEPRP